MGAERTIDTGRKDSLGRPIKVSSMNPTRTRDSTALPEFHTPETLISTESLKTGRKLISSTINKNDYLWTGTGWANNQKETIQDQITEESLRSTVNYCKGAEGWEDFNESLRDRGLNRTLKGMNKTIPLSGTDRKISKHYGEFCKTLHGFSGIVTSEEVHSDSPPGFINDPREGGKNISPYEGNGAPSVNRRTQKSLQEIGAEELVNGKQEAKPEAFSITLSSHDVYDKSPAISIHVPNTEGKTELSKEDVSRAVNDKLKTYYNDPDMNKPASQYAAINANDPSATSRWLRAHLLQERWGRLGAKVN